MAEGALEEVLSAVFLSQTVAARLRPSTRAALERAGPRPPATLTLAASAAPREAPPACALPGSHVPLSSRSTAVSAAQATSSAARATASCRARVPAPARAHSDRQGGPSTTRRRRCCASSPPQPRPAARRASRRQRYSPGWRSVHHRGAAAATLPPSCLLPSREFGRRSASCMSRVLAQPRRAACGLPSPRALSARLSSSPQPPLHSSLAPPWAPGAPAARRASSPTRPRTELALRC